MATKTFRSRGQPVSNRWDSDRAIWIQRRALWIKGELSDEEYFGTHKSKVLTRTQLIDLNDL